jgi:hypothetical protein
MSKDLFKQAIAEAKSVREAAIANAKEALEESLTPHLKDMLAAKLQEMETSEEVEEAKHDKKDETIEEAPKEDEKHEAIEEVEITEEPEVAEAEHEEEAEDDSEESEDEAPIEEPADDMPDGDEDISKLSIDQFKDIVRDIIAQESGAEHGEEELPVDDMDGGDIEGMGDEPSLEDPALDGAEEEEIDLDELLRELESETSEEVEEAKHDDKDENVEEAKEDHKDEGKKDDKKMEEEVTEESNELQEALETIETLKKDLNEVNLLNSKLLYVNKIFKSNDLSESQKVNIIAAFDKEESVKEVKLVFETVSDSVVGKKESTKTIKESKAKLGMASKAGGTTAAKPEVISEVSDTVRRMQKLAGIIN